MRSSRCWCSPRCSWRCCFAARSPAGCRRFGRWSAAVAGPFGLGVDAVRSLGSLSIESFELQATGREDHLSLNAVLRNKDAQIVRWPAMELILTDQASTVVVRKVILPSDYLNRNAPRDGLAGRSEWPIRLEPRSRRPAAGGLFGRPLLSLTFPRSRITDLAPRSSRPSTSTLPRTPRPPPTTRNQHDVQTRPDQRLGSLRHHHGLRRPLQGPHPARSGPHAERVVPDAATEARGRRLCRQHRLQPEPAGRRACHPGRGRRGRRGLRARAGGAQHRRQPGQGAEGHVHAAGVHHHRPVRQPDHRLPPGRDGRSAPGGCARSWRRQRGASCRPTASRRCSTMRASTSS